MRLEPTTFQSSDLQRHRDSFPIDSPRSACCFCSAPRLSRSLRPRDPRRFPRRRPCLSAPRGPCSPPPAAGACSGAWPWSAGSADAVRTSAVSPSPADPWPCCHSGSHSRCDAAGRARSAAAAAPSPRCAAAPRNPPSSRRTAFINSLESPESSTTHRTDRAVSERACVCVRVCLYKTHSTASIFITIRLLVQQKKWKIVQICAHIL